MNEINQSTDDSDDILISIREAFNPEVHRGYLPVPKQAIEDSEAAEEGIVVCYEVNYAPPGTQISFLLDKLFLTNDPETVLCAFNYPREMLQRIEGYQQICLEDTVFHSTYLH